MNIEEYLKKFHFEKISPEVKERIWRRIEKKTEYTQREKILLIDRLGNWKYAVSVGTVILALLTLNLYMKGMQRYAEEILPVVSCEEQILDPDTRKILTFLDENPEASVLDYLRCVREREQEKSIKDYILRIEELLG